MSELLLVEASEELQTLAEELERAEFRVRACPLVAVADYVSSGAIVDVLLINMMSEADDATVSELLRADSLPPHTVTVAILRPQQLAELDPQLALDDFIVYPAPVDEVLARIRRAIRRRVGADDSQLIRCGDLTIDQAGYKVFIGTRPIDLTYKEYELLRFLALNQDKVCTRETLLQRVWGYDFYGGARTVDVHIRRLRSKIEDHTNSYIETVRNVGYRLHAG